MSKKNKDLEPEVNDAEKDEALFEVNDEMIEVNKVDDEEETVEATATVRLNIREQPSDSSETNIVTIVNAGASLTVYPDSSTPIFYKVKTSSGIEGFAMRRFVIFDEE